jgi:UDP-N-acetylmuramoyl-tripeptide--D-alanyl-D-alanine ligase
MIGLHFVLLVVGASVFLRRRLLNLLGPFQQEEYDGRRFVAWCARRRAFDRRGTTVLVPTAALLAAVHGSPWGALGAAAVGTAALILRSLGEDDPRQDAKKPLVMTRRAVRIHRTGVVLAVSAAALLAGTALAVGGSRGPAAGWLALALLVQAAPLVLPAATALLAPGERRIQAGFRQSAVSILGSVDPYVIGITGSYGKTSVKWLLRDLMLADGPTFSTDRSINTVMGITREIREKMRPHHKWAIIEMGAYEVGSIQRLCDFTPPHAGIVTAVGPMHLERFGSLEAVLKAKAELAANVPADGILVCNGDDAGARRIAAECPKATTLLYGFEGDDLDCRMSQIETTERGSSFSLTWRGQTFDGSTRLYGRPMLSNLMAAFTMAAALGVHPEVLLALARDLRPPPNRLEVKVQLDSTWIHDAYNSNPIGFSAALDVLRDMPGSRRILVTPGMVELGEQQEVENRRVAQEAGAVCDLVYLVGDTNRAALRAGLIEGGLPEESVLQFDRRDDALIALDSDMRSGDVILIENDLPDLYETALRL